MTSYFQPELPLDFPQASPVPACTVRAGLASSSAGAGETEAPRDGEGG